MEKAQLGIQSLFPLSSKSKKLVLKEVSVKEPEGNLKEQREALLKGESLTAAIYGTFSLESLEGHVIDTDKVKILDLPILTERSTFVVQGKDYSVFNQVRLRPGVYTRSSEDSDNVAARFNLGKGLGFRINMDASKGIFYIQFDASQANTGGQAKVPVFTLLKTLGASDDHIKEVIGDTLYQSNLQAADMVDDLNKLVNLCVYVKARTGNHAEDLKKYFSTTQLNPETTKVTLKEAFHSVTADAILAAMKKMLKVYTGEENEDDMDSLLFKEILSAEDHIMLRIEKGAKQSNGPLYKIRRKLESANKVRECVPLNFLSKLVETFYTTSSLSSPQTEINPIEILETQAKITAMGEGGIKSEHGIPMSARNLHPSHFGFIDPVRTTESLRVGVDTRMTHTSVVKNRNIYSKFLDKGGKTVELRPIDMVGKYVGFAGQGDKAEVKVLHDGEMIEVPRSKVDYWMADADNILTYTSRMVPYLDATQGNRATMASRMITQAVPLVHREAPKVQTMSDSGTHSIEEEYGKHYFSPRAPHDGTIREVTDDYIRLDKEKIYIYKNFPFNYKSAYHMTPCVKVGETVKKGQVLATSNYTDHEGTLALGTNLRTAYVPYKGWNHEDGIVVSESAAKKLTSEHMYSEEIELDGNTIIDKRQYAMLFPSKITPAQLDNLDANGVAIVGKSYSKGDPVITALSPRQFTESDRMLQRMHGSLANPYKDSTVHWEHDRPGEVTDVVRTGKMIKLIFKTVDETRVGDKLCYDPATEALTSKGWKPIYEVTLEDKVCCLDTETNRIQYDNPQMIHEYDHNGRMVRTKSRTIDSFVTLEHKQLVKRKGSETFELTPASDFLDEDVYFKRSAEWHRTRVNQAIVKLVGYIIKYGYYIRGNIILESTGTEADNIESLLQQEGARFKRQKDQFVIVECGVYNFLKAAIPDADTIPRWLYKCDMRDLALAFDIIMGGATKLSSTNKKFIDDMQSLALHAGKCGIVGKDRNYWYFKVGAQNTGEVLVLGNCNTVESYMGKVYCCTVPTHVIYVRRNGKAYWSGNSGRFGNKGTVTLILPDNEMPHTNDNKPMDMLLNPAGVISRVNPGQLYETMAGKIAEKTGKNQVVKNFDGSDRSKQVLSAMKKHGLAPEENLVDPKTGKSIGDVFVGNQYVLKLHKQTEGNFGARSTGKYDANMQPAKGGEEGAKAVGLQDFYALLGHNARGVMREVTGFKAEKNEEFWDAIKLGKPIPPIKQPFVFDKFKALMGATGVHVGEDAQKQRYVVTPLTDKHVDALSVGEIKSGLLLKGHVDDLIPEKDGLFDRELTGGLAGKNWTHINLAEPIAHPLFTKQIKTIIGKDPESMTGMELKKELSKINVKGRITELKKEVATTKGITRDKAIKELRYLQALDRMGMKPQDYVLSKFPVIPPVYRPVYPSPNGGSPMIADLNNLYKDLVNTNEALKELKDFPDEHKGDLRKALNQAAGAVIGVTDPVNEKSKKQELKGALRQVVGGTAKDGFFHRKMLYKTQDSVGRGTILPNPGLHVDECEIPKDMAMQLYKPFIIRTLVRMGKSPIAAAEEVKNKTELAERIMHEEMKERPVMLNRAPTLHKYNLMAFKPKPIEGKSIFIPPLVIKGFAAD